MRKTLFLLLIAALTGCSKSSQEPASNTTIEYKYNADVSDSYQVVYTDENNNPVMTTFTGTTWDKVITTNASTGFKWAEFQMTTATLPLYTINGSAQILVNGKVQNEDDTVFSNGGPNSFAFHVVVFK